MHCNGMSIKSGKLYHLRFLLPLAIIMLSFLTSCGKKGSPTLRAYEKPSPPAGLSAIHREDKIILKWDFPAKKEFTIADFIILKSTGSEFNKLVHIEKSKRTYEDTDFEINRNYRYKIISRNIIGINSDDSNTIGLKPLRLPTPPSGLSFTAQNSSMLLTWIQTDKGMAYNVYKSFEKGTYGLTPVNNSPISDSSFTDSFSVNKIVYYTVRALHGSDIRDEGAPSKELMIDPAEFIPAPLKNFRYHAASDRVFLSWDEAEESWITRFRVYRRTEGKDYLLIGETQIPVFVDIEPALTKRDYRLHAVGPIKEGPGIELRDVHYVSVPE